MPGTTPRLLALAAAVTALTGSALAADYKAPRNAAGAPDFDGLWSNNSLTGLERPDDLKTLVPTDAEVVAYEKAHRGKPPDFGPDEDTVGAADSEWFETDVGLARIRGLPRSSWITSPSDGQVPSSDAAKAAGKARRERRKIDFDNPEIRPLAERCIAPGASPPMTDNGNYNDNFQFVQTADTLAISAEWMHDVRIIPLNGGRHPPASVRLWMGDSIGHWEGETLVIETTNFTQDEVNDPTGNPDSDVRVVERFTRDSPTTLFYEFSVEGPSRFIQTWRGEAMFHATKGPIYEFACHEGNYALANILAGARQADAAKAKAGASPVAAAGK